MHREWWTYLLHLRAPGQLWMRFWMVGCEKPKKSAPDGTMGATGLELKKKRAVCVTKMYEESASLTNPRLWAHCTWQTRWPSGGWSGTSGRTRPRWRSEGLLLVQSQTGDKNTDLHVLGKFWRNAVRPMHWFSPLGVTLEPGTDTFSYWSQFIFMKLLFIPVSCIVCVFVRLHVCTSARTCGPAPPSLIWQV